MTSVRTAIQREVRKKNHVRAEWNAIICYRELKYPETPNRGASHVGPAEAAASAKGLPGTYAERVGRHAAPNVDMVGQAGERLLS